MTAEVTVTCAAMTRCLWAIRLHLAHWQSLQLQKRLWPFRAEKKPWFLQREHLGILGDLRDLEGDCGLDSSGFIGRILLMTAGMLAPGTRLTEMAKVLQCLECAGVHWVSFILVPGFEITAPPMSKLGKELSNKNDDNNKRTRII